MDHDHNGHHHDHTGHSHDHGHGHGHDHGHGHVHAPANFGKAFALGISLNIALVVAEAIYGYIGNSTALLADAGHNLSDVLGRVVAWGASVAAKRAPAGRFTYGFRASTILAALANEAGPARDIVALNAGASIYVAGLAPTLAAGVERAQKLIAGGEARRKLDQFVRFTQAHG